MAIQLRTRKRGVGYIGYIVCVLRGRVIWSESSGVVRATREDAREDSRWLRDQQQAAGAKALDADM